MDLEHPRFLINDTAGACFFFYDDDEQASEDFCVYFNEYD